MRVFNLRNLNGTVFCVVQFSAFKYTNLKPVVGDHPRKWLW